MSSKKLVAGMSLYEEKPVKWLFWGGARLTSFKPVLRNFLLGPRQPWDFFLTLRWPWKIFKRSRSRRHLNFIQSMYVKIDLRCFFPYPVLTLNGCIWRSKSRKKPTIVKAEGKIFSRVQGRSSKASKVVEGMLLRNLSKILPPQMYLPGSSDAIRQSAKRHLQEVSG